MKSNFDVREKDGDLEIREKVRKGLSASDIDEASTIPYLLELLSVKDSGIDKIPMSPAARKDRITEAVKRITLKGSDKRPLIVAVEDLHWIDRSSEEYLKNLLDSISGARVFLIFTYRPEFVHTWGGRSYHSQVNLNRLSNRESLAMVTYILSTEKIDSNLEELILEKTEGVPFFIEEFMKSLKELKIIESKDGEYHLAKGIQEVSIPSKIQDVIMAKVDSLPEGAKNVLQTGSVIEREFSHELIMKVMGSSQEDLLSHLSVLKDSELLYERGIYPQSTYIFKHAITQEVVYDSILVKRKKKLHEEIADVLEKIFENNMDEQYAVLAEHYIIAENYLKGAEYSRLAEKKAEKAASFPDAIAYAKKGITCLEKLPRTNDLLKKIIDARTILGLYMFQLFYIAEAKEIIDPIFDLTVKNDFKKRVAQIYFIRGTYECWVNENMFEANKYYEEALQIAEDVQDIVSTFFINVQLGTTSLLNCEFAKAIDHVQEALDINRAANNLWGIAIMQSTLGQIYCYQGRTRLAYQTTTEAVKIAEESGDIYSKAWVFALHGMCLYFMGHFDDSELYLLKGLDYGKKINWYYITGAAHIHLGYISFIKAEYKKAGENHNKAISAHKMGQYFPSWIQMLDICISRSKVMNNEQNIDLVLLYDGVTKNNLKLHDSRIKRHISETLLNMDNKHMNEAETWIKKAIKFDKEYGMQWHLGRDYALYAELFKRKESPSEAKENLNKAIEILGSCSADGWVEKYENELATLS